MKFVYKCDFCDVLIWLVDLLYSDVFGLMLYICINLLYFKVCIFFINFCVN